MTTTSIGQIRFYWIFSRPLRVVESLDSTRAHKIHPRIFDLALIHNVLFSPVYFYNPLLASRCLHPHTHRIYRDPILQKAVTPVTPHCDKTSHVFQSKGMDAKKKHTTERRKKNKPIISPQRVCFYYLYMFCRTRDDENSTLRIERYLVGWRDEICFFHFEWFVVEINDHRNHFIFVLPMSIMAGAL